MNVVAISPHADMPKAFFKRWLELKKYLVTNTLQQKTIFESGFDMPHLNRSEGGCGGDSNWFDRQIRPIKWEWGPAYDANMLYLNFCDSNNKECTWDIQEMQALSSSVCEVISHKIGSGGTCFHAFFILKT